VFDLLDEFLFSLGVPLEDLLFAFRLTSVEELFHTRILLQAASSHANEVPHASWQDGFAPGFQLVDGCFYLIEQLFLTERRNEIFQGLFIKDLTQ